MQSDCVEKKHEGNGNSKSCVVAAAANFEEQQKKEEEEEDSDTKSLLMSGRKGSMRRVRFNDRSLAQIIEFQPSDSSDTENDSREGLSLGVDAVAFCAQLCFWLCRPRC